MTTGRRSRSRSKRSQSSSTHSRYDHHHHHASVLTESLKLRSPTQLWVSAVQEARKATAAADAKRQTEEKEKAARLADPDAHRIGGWMMKPTAAPGAGAGGGKKGGVGKYLSSAAFKH